MRVHKNAVLAALPLLIPLAAGGPALAAKVCDPRNREKDELWIRIGTVAPTDTLWHETLKHLRQDWERITGGLVCVQIYPDGRLGDGPEMVRQVRSNRIQAVGLSSVGLSRIDPSVSALQIPLLFESYEELDYVRDRLSGELERRMEKKGFKLLHWADAGWVYSFSKVPVKTPQELRKLKLFTSAGDPETERLYKEFGFLVVPLALTDLITSLQTGMVEAVNLPPLFALLSDIHRQAPYMLGLKWTPLIAGTVISVQAWESIPEKFRPEMLAAARQAGDLLRPQIRKMDKEAIREMEIRGLTAIELDEETRKAWQAEALKAYPKLRGRYAPSDLFDQALRLSKEFRKSKAQPSALGD